MAPSDKHTVPSIQRNGVELDEDTQLQYEEEEIEIKHSLLKLRRRQLKNGAGEADVLEKQELEKRLQLIRLLQSPKLGEEAEEQQLEIEELELDIKRIKLRRKRLQPKETSPGPSPHAEKSKPISKQEVLPRPPSSLDSDVLHVDNSGRSGHGMLHVSIPSPILDDSVLSKDNQEGLTKPTSKEEETKASGKRLARVTLAFDSQGEGELTISVGQVWTIEHQEQEWTLLSSSTDDQHGWVPSAHLTTLLPRPMRRLAHSQEDISARPPALSATSTTVSRNFSRPQDSQKLDLATSVTNLGTPLEGVASKDRDGASTEQSDDMSEKLTKLELLEDTRPRIESAQSIEESQNIRVADHIQGDGQPLHKQATLESEDEDEHRRARRDLTADGHQDLPDIDQDAKYTESSRSSIFSGRRSSYTTAEDSEAAYMAAAEEASKCISEGRYGDLPPQLQEQLVEEIEHRLPARPVLLENDAGFAENSKPMSQDLSSEALTHGNQATANSSSDQKAQSQNTLWNRITKGKFSSREPSSEPRGRTISKEPEQYDDIDTNVCQCGRMRFPEGECFYCWPCDGRIFCDECWSTWPLHRRHGNSSGVPGLPHEKCAPDVARKIFGTLHANGNLEQQALLHIRDSDTSWFGTGIDEDTGDTIFQDFGRYADLMAVDSDGQKQSRYPGLVSFVGQTGAGKSSLIRLLIELHAPTGAAPQVPVVGSNIHADLPTSGDVHLYADLMTFETSEPMLFADCEGLDGGEREPMGAKSRRKEKNAGPGMGRTYSLNRHIRKQYHTADREILWANTALTKSREYHVRHLYPRLLYTFSDVIVFVMKNPRVIENTIEQLIKWAAAALETSSNQPVLPHAIIVLNAYDNASDPDMWDVDKSTIDLLEKVGRAVHQHHSLRTYAEFWRERGKAVETVEMLLLSYYSSIRVVRVPERGRPKLIEEQTQKLYHEIAIATERSRESKHRVRLLLNSDELQPYLQYAFDHFCRNLERPFDFVQASFANNPIPSNFGGNILKLAIDIMDLWKDRLDAPSIFKELSFMVASCIMVDSARHRTLGPAEKVFGAYYHHCDSAIEDFCDRHWPCEYVQANTQGRCVNVKAGHTKGHQLSSGKILAVGPYQSEISPQILSDFFQTAVFWNLVKLLERLNQATLGQPHLEVEEAAKIHRSLVLNSFYQHLQGPRNFVSHSACYSCLVSPPEHGLPCGHVICTPCAQMFGRARGNCYMEMTECPMHHDDADGQFQTRWPITLKPRGAGIRILSIDGGGIRGIIELTILKQIQQHLGPLLPIQLFFDLIVGTSTGGIIALGLGANGWSVNKCAMAFEDLCKQAFTKRNDYGLPGLGFILSSWHHSRYETGPIESALKSAFGSEQHLFAGSRDDVDNSTLKRLTKVGVTTATTAGTAVLLTNYNRTDEQDEAPYQFHRAEKAKHEIRTWEAARATSAAPTYFKPYAHEASGQVYADGALRYNNPVEVAYREQKLIWPDRAESCPDVVLSLGTGFNKNVRKPLKAKKPGRGFIAGAKFFKSTISGVVYATLNSEQTWRNFVFRSNWPSNLSDRYIRLNLKMDANPPELDMVDSLPSLKRKTEQQFPHEGPEIADITNRLLATTFYFMLDTDPTITLHHGQQKFVISGTIECRLVPGSEEIRALGDLLRKRQLVAYNQNYARHSPYFVIQERRQESKAKQVVLSPERIDAMRNQGIFSMERISIEVTDSRAENEILFCFADQKSKISLYPISGFPRCFMDEVAKVHRVNVDDVNMPDAAKFATIFASLEARKSRFDFAAAEFLRSKDPFTLFNSSEYTNPGGTTKANLRLLSERFSHTNTSSTTIGSKNVHEVGVKPTNGLAKIADLILSSSSTDANDDPQRLSDQEYSRRQWLRLLISSSGHVDGAPRVSLGQLSDHPEFLPFSDSDERGTSGLAPSVIPGVVELPTDSSRH